MNPKVSVIMNCYNSSRYLREAIDSVYAQTFDNWEIIFWDNASSDDSAEIAKSYDEKIKYFSSKETVPLGQARNWAIKKASGEFVAFLDCDDIWLPTKLKKQVSIFQGDNAIDFVYSNYYEMSSVKVKKIANRETQPSGYIFPDMLRNYTIGMLTVMIRKKKMNDLETLFDTSFNLAEEYDLFMRLLYVSRAIYIAEPLSIYRMHPEMLSYKHRDGWVDELRLIYSKIRALDKEGRYSDIISKKEVNLYKSEALVKLSKNKLCEARIIIAPYKFLTLKNLIIYFITYMPLTIWELFRPYLKKGIFFR